LKKKRLVLLIVLVAAAWVGWQYGVVYAAVPLAALVVMLGALSLAHRAAAHRGVADLEALQATHGYARQAEQARENLGDGDTLTFVALGDTRNKRRTAEAVYRAAAAERPALAFHTGDIVRHGTAKEFLENHVPLLDIFAPAPLVCVPGNHERGARRDFAAYRALYGDTRFTFDVGNCCFVGVNNSGKERLSEEDLDYLARALEATSATHRFAFLHIPPAFFEATFVSDDQRRGFTKRADVMHRLFVDRGVREVFMAHIHGYASTVIDGVRYTLTAGGGAPLSSRLAPGGQYHHYVVLRVTGAEIEREVVRLKGGAWVREFEPPRS